MSDLKIDARLKEINIKIRAMEGEQTRRRLEAANGLNEELHAVDDKFHEDMKSLKERYMQERQSIEDRYFADRKSIDKEYEDKRLDLINSIKEVIGDISEVVGFETSKLSETINNFASSKDKYISDFNNHENIIETNNSMVSNSITHSPLTSLDDIEQSLGNINNGFDPIEPTVNNANNFSVSTNIPEITNDVVVDSVSSPENLVPEPVINYSTVPEPIMQNEVPVIENFVQQMPVSVQPIVQEQVNEQPQMPASQVIQPVQEISSQEITQNINTSIDNVLDDININVN